MKPIIISKQHALCKAVKFFAFCYLSEAFLCDEVQKEALSRPTCHQDFCVVILFSLSLGLLFASRTTDQAMERRLIAYQEN